MRALAASSTVMIAFVVGCSPDPIPAEGWVADLAVTGADHQPLPPRLTATAGDAVDTVVAYRPGTPDPDAFPGRTVRPHDKWRLRAEVLNSSGEIQAAEPVVSLYGELHGFDLHGAEHVQAGGPGGQAGEPAWKSPEPTKEIKKALADFQKDPKDRETRRYLWGHTRVPDAPGEYRLVIRLYPTADPRITGETGPEMGPPIDLAEFPLVVTAREGDRPKVSSNLMSDLAFRNSRGSHRPMAGRGPGPGRFGRGAPP